MTNFDRLFEYHPPVGTQATRYKDIRTKARELAEFAVTVCPESPERTIGIRKLQECVMMLNASIAIHEADESVSRKAVPYESQPVSEEPQDEERPLSEPVVPEEPSQPEQTGESEETIEDPGGEADSEDHPAPAFGL